MRGCAPPSRHEATQECSWAAHRHTPWQGTANRAHLDPGVQHQGVAPMPRLLHVAQHARAGGGAVEAAPAGMEVKAMERLSVA